MANDRLEIKPATRHDLKYFYGDKVRNSCRAWSAFYDGKLAGVGGVAITSNLMLVFMNMDLVDDVPDLTIWRASLKIWDKIKEIGYPILYAVADNELMSAQRFVLRLGFEQVCSEEGNLVFRWLK